MGWFKHWFSSSEQGQVERERDWLIEAFHAAGLLLPGEMAFNAGILGGGVNVSSKPFAVNITPNSGFGDGGETAFVHFTHGAEAVTAITIGGAAATIISKGPDFVEITTPTGTIGPRRVVAKVGSRIIHDDAILPVTFNYLTNPDTGPIGTVTDLADSAITTTTITYEWTEVTDGAAAYADNYQIRISTDANFGSDPTTFWNAFEQSADVAGTGLGNTASHQFTGLQPGTTYYAAVVGYEGTLGVDAEFGPISSAQTDVTSAGVAAPTITSVAVDAYDDVEVKCSAFSGPNTHESTDWQIDEAGGDFSTPVAEYLNDTVNLTSRTFTDNLTDDADFDVRCRHKDSVVGLGAYGNVFTFTHTPPPAGDGLFGNQPAGLTVLTTMVIAGEPRTLESGDAVSVDGFWEHWKVKTKGKVIADSTVPDGSGKSIECKYPAIVGGGHNMAEPCRIDFELWKHGFQNYRDNATECYWAVTFKRSLGWLWHQVGDKILFFMRAQNNGQVIVGQPRGNKAQFLIEPDDALAEGSGPGGSAKYNVSYPWVAGDWYHMEWYWKRPAPPITSGNNELKLWISHWNSSTSTWEASSLVLDITDPADSKDNKWRMCSHAPTYGGGNDPDIITDQFIYWGPARVAMKIP